MTWEVLFHQEFKPEFDEFEQEIQDELLAYAKLLQDYGPHLKRPHADTLNGSYYKNMKELRFKITDGVWRIAFAFDPERKAILLVGGNKVGVNQKRFYKQLIAKADKRFENHLNQLKEKGESEDGNKA
ncbi:MAG: type II toxin-antitoxin system RelE/ParE family toxin [Cyanobacteriota bacterium]|nr:type II toxin-antitoxin system RelE/ParE family toxin [Cyanobacteriota bacterium]